MKKIILLLNFIAASFVFSNSVSALSCMQSTLQDDINRASAIFVGRVTSVSSENATFQVSRYWKGGVSQNQTVSGTTAWSGGPVGNIFYTINSEYIVYTTRDQNGIERSSIDCGRTQKFSSDAEAQISTYLGTPKFFNITPYNPPTPNPTQSYCAYSNIGTNMWLGNWNNSRNEVRMLQNYLFNYYGVANEINASGFFGRLTKNYVSQFQREQGLYPVTGGVGPITRTKMKELCSSGTSDLVECSCEESKKMKGEDPSICALIKGRFYCSSKVANSNNCKIYFDGCNTCSRQYPGGPQMCTLMACINQGNNGIWNSGAYCKEYFTNNTNAAPVVKSFTGPVQLRVGEKGTWKIEASSYNNQPLSYNVTWGDEGTELYKSAAPLSMSAIFNQQTTFEHTYNRVGTFTVRVEVRSQDGQTTTTTQTVNVLQNDVAYCTSEYNPVCGQPPMPYCQPGFACIQAYPAPRTYSNICLMNKDNATLIYYGSCR